MKTTRNKRLATAIAAACLVAALWSPLASGQQAAQDKPQAQERPRLGEMAKDLFNITPEQEKQIQELRDARMKDLKPFRDQMVKMRGEMRDLMKDSKANAAKIDGLIDGMSKLRADRQKTAVRTLGEWEKIFTPEQLAKMKKCRGAFAARPGFGGGIGHGFAGLWLGRFMGPRGMGMGARGAWGWRMGRPGRFWHRTFFWRQLQIRTEQERMGSVPSEGE